MRERAGLVEDDRLRLGDRLQKPPALDGELIGARLLHRGEHRDGHGELECAGEIHHQHGERAGGVARDEPDERRSAETVRHKAVRQMRRLALRPGLELFRLLYHLHNAVVPPRAAALFHTDGATALLHDGAGIDVAALAPAHGQRLAGDGGMIDHGLAVDHLAVERDHVAGVDCYHITDLYVAHGDEHVARLGLHPDLVDIERHTARKVCHGLLVRPLVERLAHAEQEHYRARRGKIAAQHRHCDSRRVEHGHLYLPAQQARKPRLYVVRRAPQCHHRAHRHGQDELIDAPAQHRVDEPVLILSVQRTRAVLRRECRRRLIRKARQRRGYLAAPRGVDNDRVTGAVIYLHIIHARDGAQVRLQYVRLQKRHARLRHAHAHTPRRFMQDRAFHG